MERRLEAPIAGYYRWTAKPSSTLLTSTENDTGFSARLDFLGTDATEERFAIQRDIGSI